jgi:putative ABC transport system permease protein
MFRFAFRNLLSRPARSLLSLLGLTVAITGMVGLFSIASGIDSTVADTFGRFPGLLIMQKGAPIPLFSRVPKAWAKEVESIPGIHVVSAEIWVRVNTINRKNIVSPPRFLFGADIAAHQRLRYSVYEEEIREGRYLNETDSGKAHTVISRQIAEQFEVKVGDSINVNGADFEIIGIYHCGSLLLDMAVIVDQPIVRQMSLFDPATVCSFYAEPTGEIPNEELVERMREMFQDRDLSSWTPTSLLSLGGDSSTASSRGSSRTGNEPMPTGNPVVDLVRGVDHWIKTPRTADAGDESPVDAPPKEESVTLAETADGPHDGPLEIRSAADWADRFDEFTSELDISLTVLTGLGLSIAVLSIINTMLMSVTERIIEFGILKANGWSRSDVTRLITCESAILGFGGGVTGALIGWLLTQIVNWKWESQIYLVASPTLLVTSIVFATALGIGGGLYPAIWATRMMPMDAIRRG